MHTMPLPGLHAPNLLPWMAAAGVAVTLSDTPYPARIAWRDTLPELHFDATPPGDMVRLALILTAQLDVYDRVVWDVSTGVRTLAPDIRARIEQAADSPESRREADLLAVLTHGHLPMSIRAEASSDVSPWCMGNSRQDFFSWCRHLCRDTTAADILSALTGPWQMTAKAGLGMDHSEDTAGQSQHCRGVYRLALESLRLMPAVDMMWDAEIGRTRVRNSNWTRDGRVRYPAPADPVSPDALRSLLLACIDPYRVMPPGVVVMEARKVAKRTNSRHQVISPGAAVA